MNKNEIKFKISDTFFEQEDHTHQSVNQIIDNLNGFEYHGKLSTSNSKQLTTYFDEELIKKLEIEKHNISPVLKPDIFNTDWGRPKADLIFNFKNYPVVIEIEKSNKKTIWFDFIKIWMFIESKQAESGILICPNNYAHRHGVWNLYDEACKYKKYLQFIASVPEEKLNKIEIIGYKQLVRIDGIYKKWNEETFKQIRNI